MNREDYRRIVDRMEPDAGLENRLASGIGNGNREGAGRRRGWLAAGAALLIVIGAGIAALEWGDGTHRSADPAGNTQPPLATPTASTGGASAGAVTIPKIKLPEGGSNAQADMVGLVVYKGNVYTQTSASVAPEAAKALVGEKLGRTTGGIDEWSEKSAYTELASTIGVTDIYSVRGYDSDFRIMAYKEQDGHIYSELYEHLNGIAVGKGEDLVGPMKLKGRITSVRWQNYDSWYNSKPQYRELAVDPTLEAFVSALYGAKPIAFDTLYKEGITRGGADNEKVLYLKLDDQTEITLWLYKGNYVQYAGAAVFLQADSSAFSALWDAMNW